jgi:hypothetical protein
MADMFYIRQNYLKMIRNCQLSELSVSRQMQNTYHRLVPLLGKRQLTTDN